MHCEGSASGRGVTWGRVFATEVLYSGARVAAITTATTAKRNKLNNNKRLRQTDRAVAEEGVGGGAGRGMRGRGHRARTQNKQMTGNKL